MDNLDDPRLNFNYRTRERGTVPMDTKRDRFQWVSEVAYKNVHRIVSRGYDTTELVENGYGLTDVLFVDFQARIPLIEEEKMLNYVMVVMLEDGLSSPANIARIVASGKTILTQAAGSSILAFGHAYGAYQTFGRMLDGILARQAKEGKPLAEVVEAVVKERLNDPALGVSCLMLKDPTAKRMIVRAEKLGVAGRYVSLIKEIVKAAQKLSKEPVDIDLLGATGAVMFDIGFTPEATWGILAVTRAFATGAHYCEEVECEDPVRLGQTLTPKEWYVGPEDRPVPTLEERKKVARAMEAQTPQEWKETFTERQKIQGSGWAIVEEIDDPRRKI
ncbi:MAG: citrate/2-methylcitrate synthase [Syntrophales bacterium]